jgi:hypothetical protein
MAHLRQISKKKLMKFITEHRLDDEYHGSIIITNELLHAIESGDLDMAKDWRLTKDEM